MELHEPGRDGESALSGAYGHDDDGTASGEVPEHTTDGERTARHERPEHES